MSKAAETSVALNIAVLTISDSWHSGNDTSGDYLATSAQEAGHRCVQRMICPDDIYRIRSVISQWVVDDDIQVILSNGSTGHGKSAARAIVPLLDNQIAGFGELFRHLSFLEIGSSSLQSDAFAGSANGTLIFCMPGSTGACRTAWEGILRDQLDSSHRPCNFGSGFRSPK